MRNLFRLVTLTTLTAMAISFGGPGTAQEVDLETLRQRLDSANVLLLQDLRDVNDLVRELDSIKYRLVVTNDCQFARYFNPEKKKICNDLLVEAEFKLLVLLASENALEESRRLYNVSLEKYLQALGREIAIEGILSPSGGGDGPSNTSQNQPGAGAQAGIVARLIQVQPCVYRSGGRPATRSNYYCVVEYSLTNTTDAGIHFTSGTVESNHAWNGEMVESNIGYGRILTPGQTLNLSAHCVIPHAGSVGTWVAIGTGQHRGVTPPTPSDQFGWSLSTTCTR